jgi:CheY-like chemotaxis protein
LFAVGGRPGYNSNVHARTILVVDDDRKVLKTVREFLHQGGYVVHTTTHAELAVDLAVRIHPALAILDISMPGMTGFDVAEALHDHPTTRKVPCMFLTAEGAASNIEDSRAVGVQAYLQKPFRRETLLSMISTLLSEESATV